MACASAAAVCCAVMPGDTLGCGTPMLDKIRRKSPKVGAEGVAATVPVGVAAICSPALDGAGGAEDGGTKDVAAGVGATGD